MKRMCWILALALLLTGCAGQIMDGPDMVNSYKQITVGEARQMMAQEDGHLFIDVRSAEEYEAGHIHGAISIPSDSLGSELPSALPNTDQILLVYGGSEAQCCAGAEKLFDLGYRNVYAFGSILDWDDELETGPAGELHPTLTLHSFDGGGPEYSIGIEDPSILYCASEIRYSKANHEELEGAGYTETFTFTALKPGQTRVTLSARSPIAGNYDQTYLATVDDALRIRLTEESFVDYNAPEIIEPTRVLVVVLNEDYYYATLEDSAAAEAFVTLLNDHYGLQLTMQDNGGYEKFGTLPETLAASDETMTAQPGDIVLSEGNRLSILYGENTASQTRLAHLDMDLEALQAALGDGDVTVSLWVEWGE